MKPNRIELIIATAIFLFALIVISSSGYAHWSEQQILSAICYASIIYITFVVFNQWIWPSWFRNKRVEGGVILTLLLFFCCWIGISVCVWVRSDNQYLSGSFWPRLTEGEPLGITSLVFLGMFAYEGLKIGIAALRAIRMGPSRRIVQESLIILGGGIVIFLFLLAVNGTLAALWLSTVPYAYIIYSLNTRWLLPLSEKRQYTSVMQLLFIGGISFLIFIPFGILFLNASQLHGAVFFLQWICINAAVIPLSNFIYQRQKERNTNLVSLRQELGQTSAGLSFLRSQINPHFLFNILNTLYGTALQENAERTSTGIQKLGDMMRFMLHENNQDRILLAREIEYLRNYVDLQQLRTATTSSITVECDIKDVLEGSYIAPMLLIPFVENAFKHGISLQERSWIRISLNESDGTLYFDVHNSIHRKPDSDPEQRHSGVGLENVKQRLVVLYPKKHELVIRETTQEFFVHLTIQL